MNHQQVINIAFNLIYNWTEAKFPYNLQAGLLSLMAFGGLCVNWEADVQTTRQRAIVDSELCLGLCVSLLTANWHPARTNKVHHPDPPVPACTVCLLSVCVVSWSGILPESHGWKTSWTRNLLNPWCESHIIHSVSSSDGVLQFSTWNDLDTETD